MNENIQPWLVQRCIVENNELVLDYMGAAEYEWGAPSKSYERMKENTKKGKYRILVSDILDHSDNPLCFYHNLTDEEIGYYVAAIKDYIKGKCRFKESISIKRVMESPAHQARDTFWWDLEYDVMFTFNSSMLEKEISDIKEETNNNN